MAMRGNYMTAGAGIICALLVGAEPPVNYVLRRRRHRTVATRSRFWRDFA